MRTGSRFGRIASGRVGRFLLVCAAAAALAACNETASDFGLAASQPKVMAPGVPISVESLSGGSEAMRTTFAGALSQEASQRQIEIVAAGSAPRYRIRGYLDAGPNDEGKVALAYIWDVYDTKLNQARRVEGAAEIGGSPSDPWAGVDDKALQAIAARSMNEIAGFLAAAGPSARAVKTAAAPKPATTAAKPMAYAPVED
ncbi:MAG: hypothetical protein BGP06_11300 [Rhizobiales bacterium 65-9]|nr:hypothetical protein [Hyphomicrobiales bacterium]OJY32905.1 MAG: hypothetical protein BGP06_11300 [Rhizobiales bacterium 65-9]